jgi:hypothetical protein
VVRAGFPANFPLYWVVSKANSNNLYQRLTTTNVDGDLIIPKADLPAGFLLPNNFYKILVKNGNDYLQPVTFIFGSDQYNCIVSKLVKINRTANDNSAVNVIEFKEPAIAGTPAGGNNSIWTTFNNQTSFTYNHNLGRPVDVTLYNLAGELILATVTDDTVNHNFVTVTFTSPTTGRMLIDN